MGGRRSAPHARERRASGELRRRTPRLAGLLLNFAGVQFASRILINDIGVISGRNGPWCAIPSIKQFDSNGRPKLGADGKPTYPQIVEFVDRETADKFGVLIVKLIHDGHPGDLAS